MYSEKGEGILIYLLVWDVFNASCLGAASGFVKEDAAIVIIQITIRVNESRKILSRLLPCLLPEACGPVHQSLRS